jgi:hypothetical protein
MKKSLLFVIFAIVFSFLGQIHVAGQEIKKVQFSGYEVERFKGFEQTKNKNEPTYEAISQDTTKGAIILDRATKTFKIGWLKGNEWKFTYTSSQTSTRKWKKNPELGTKQTTTLFIGKNDDGCEAILQVVNWDLTGCQFYLLECDKSPSTYGKRVWQNTYTFKTNGVCFK